MFNYNRVPYEMKSLKRWVLWKKRKIADGKGVERETKIPINAMSGYGAKSNDESTWHSFDEAIANIGKFQCLGVGFMLGNGYFGIDIDHAIENKELISEFRNALGSYCEISQSGEGVHIICKGVLPPGPRRKGNIEMYDSARFFAMTGNVIDGDSAPSIAERTEEIKPLFEKYLNPKPSEGSYVYKKDYSQTAPSIGSSLSDEEVVTKAIESSNGTLFSSLYYGQWQGLYPSQSEADMSLCSMLAFWTNKDKTQIDRIFRSSKLMREKWEQKRGDKTYGEITVECAVAKCRDGYVSHKPNSVYNPLTGEVDKDSSKEYDLTDTGNAQRFVDAYGDLVRYNFDNKNWVVWDGKTWVRDVAQLTKKYADEMIEAMKKETMSEPDGKKALELWKNIKHLASNSGKEAMLKEAMHIGVIPTVNADYDRDRYLLNCSNGIVDLRTGKIMPHDRKYMMAKNTGVDCDMSEDPKEWLNALDGIFAHNSEVIAFVRKAIGYTMTGDTKEQCFFQCYGSGSNGKSVFFNTIYRMFGDYALNAQVESVLTRGNSNSGNASPDIARMNGARFVRTNEPNEGSRFNEGLVKQLTGGDIVTARYLYGSDFEFKPVFKLWIACNYKIVVRGTDKGIWRRMRLIPFEAVFEGKNDDKGLEVRIQAELPLILGWAVKGCLEWQKEGLGLPKEIEEATKEYRDEMDIVESFIKECVSKKKGSREKASDVFIAYKDWSKQGNEWCMTQSKFGVEMGKKFEKKNINGYVYYLGISLRQKEASYVYDQGDI